MDDLLTPQVLYGATSALAQLISGLTPELESIQVLPIVAWLVLKLGIAIIFTSIG